MLCGGRIAEAVVGFEMHFGNILSYPWPSQRGRDRHFYLSIHRKPKMDERRLGLEAAGWGAKLVVRSKRVEHIWVSEVDIFDDAVGD